MRLGLSQTREANLGKQNARKRSSGSAARQNGPRIPGTPLPEVRGPACRFVPRSKFGKRQAPGCGNSRSESPRQPGCCRAARSVPEEDAATAKGNASSGNAPREGTRAAARGRLSSPASGVPESRPESEPSRVKLSRISLSVPACGAAFRDRSSRAVRTAVPNFPNRSSECLRSARPLAAPNQAPAKRKKKQAERSSACFQNRAKRITPRHPRPRLPRPQARAPPPGRAARRRKCQ